MIRMNVYNYNFINISFLPHIYYMPQTYPLI